MPDLSEQEATILDRLLEIIAREGLVDRSLLVPEALLSDVGLNLDDLTLIGNAIEREFDRDMLGDNELDNVTTVRELIELVSIRIAKTT
jgi:acyl carrier protein